MGAATLQSALNPQHCTSVYCTRSPASSGTTLEDVRTTAHPPRGILAVLSNRLLPSAIVSDAADCGSMSIQTALLAKGAYVSQQQVRDHTVPGGGNDNEILETNIDLAFANLKILADGFDYKNQPVPQFDAYMTFIKQNLAAGHPIVWMILLYNGHFPVYVLVFSLRRSSPGFSVMYIGTGTRGYRTGFTRTLSRCMGSSQTTPSTTRPGMHFARPPRNVCTRRAASAASAKLSRSTTHTHTPCGTLSAVAEIDQAN